MSKKYRTCTEAFKRAARASQRLWLGQVRLAVAQRNHIGLAIRAFVRLEVHRIRTGVSCFEAKTGIIRAAVRAYLAQPTLTLCSTA